MLVRCKKQHKGKKKNSPSAHANLPPCQTTADAGPFLCRTPPDANPTTRRTLASSLVLLHSCVVHALKVPRLVYQGTTVTGERTVKWKLNPGSRHTSNGF